MKSQEVENRTLFRVLPAYEAQQCNLGVYLSARLLFRQAPLSPRRSGAHVQSGRLWTCQWLAPPARFSRLALPPARSAVRLPLR